MPSGTALKLGDVITMYGGTTVEVMNTDAEGRLVMADALVMAAAEEPRRHRRHRDPDRGDDARPRHLDRRRHGQRPGAHRPDPRRVGPHRRADVAVPARAALPARARLRRRGPQEHGRPQRRADHGGPVPRGVRRAAARGPTSTSPAWRRPIRPSRGGPRAAPGSGHGSSRSSRSTSRHRPDRFDDGGGRDDGSRRGRRRAARGSPPGCSTESSGSGTRSRTRRSCSST